MSHGDQSTTLMWGLHQVPTVTPLPTSDTTTEDETLKISFVFTVEGPYLVYRDIKYLRRGSGFGMMFVGGGCVWSLVSEVHEL